MKSVYVILALLSLVSEVFTVECDDGYFLDGNNQCQVCSFNCKTCITKSTNCISCNAGYFLPSPTGEGECQPCGFGCSSCTTGGCTGCYTKFFFEDNNCLACLPNCATCTSNSTCLRCSDGYTITTSADGSLVSCTLKDNDIRYTGILIYIIISGTLIFFLIETIRFNNSEDKERYYLGYKKQSFSELSTSRYTNISLEVANLNQTPVKTADPSKLADGIKTPNSSDDGGKLGTPAEVEPAEQPAPRLTRNMGILDTLNNRFSL